MKKTALGRLKVGHLASGAISNVLKCAPGGGAPHKRSSLHKKVFSLRVGGPDTVADLLKCGASPGEGGQQICSGCESFNQLRDPRLARHPVTQTHTHICSDHLNFAVVAFSNLAASVYYYPLLLPQSRHPASTIAAASCSSFLFAPFAIWLRNYGCTCSLS